MELSQQDKIYFHNPEGYVERLTYGVVMYRNDSMPEGVWKPLPHPIDRLISHVKIVTKTPYNAELYNLLGLHSATVSRIRKGECSIPSDWLIRMMDYSGLSLAELRAIGGLQPIVARYEER